MDISFKKLTQPTPEIAQAFDTWDNDPDLVPFIRPNPTGDQLEIHIPVTVESLQQQLERKQIYLVYAGEELVGKMEYKVDPNHLYKKEAGTAWIGIMIGEQSARGKGVGGLAMTYVEAQIKAQGLRRIELGVFEFNTSAIRLYQKLGYKEIGRIENFTFWQGRLWQDIRMEKYLE